jgi:lipopolysaccharide export system protein LptA
MTTGWKSSLFVALSAAGLMAVAADAWAAAKAAPPAASSSTSSPIQILPGTSSKEPISIDADKLVYFDKEKKAIYSGNVVVVQGDTKMTCSLMTVFLENSAAPGAAASPDSSPPAGAQNSGVSRLEATGPVTVISKNQVATGDSAIYDKVANRVQLIGHVTLSDGQNTTKGDKLTYDLKTSQATIDTAGPKSGRVHGQFIPNQGGEAPKPK